MSIKGLQNKSTLGYWKKITGHWTNICFSSQNECSQRYAIHRLERTIRQWTLSHEGNMIFYTWWRYQMEILSALLAICAGNSPVSGEFPAKKLVTRSFDVFFDLYLNKRFSKQWWSWWFETPSPLLWRHCNVHFICYTLISIAFTTCQCLPVAYPHSNKIANWAIPSTLPYPTM